jgi:hypothetical protein
MSYKDKIKNREYSNNYYHQNKNRLNTPEKRQRQSDYMREWRNRDPLKRLYCGAKSRARRLEQDFDISLSDLFMPEMCPVLNIPLFRTEGKATDNSPSLDRIDNSKGYIKGNVRIISHKANKHKADLSLEDIHRLFMYSRNAVA